MALIDKDFDNRGYCNNATLINERDRFEVPVDRITYHSYRLP